MVKTRSQTGNITVKKEEEDDKPTLGLENVRNTRTSSRIAKRQPPIISNRPLYAQQVKVEEDIDTKLLLKLTPSSSKLPKGQKFSQAQISRLINYVVNDKMSIAQASRKVNMSNSPASYYYNLYKNDPEKKIPVPRNRSIHRRTYYTQEQVENLIRYINSDNMTVAQAAAKANMTKTSGNYYYTKYLKDPNHNIPIPQLQQNYTQDQKNTLLGYIINNKMSIPTASKKAKINEVVARMYYYKYFKEQNPDMPTPSHVIPHKCYTKEQIKKLNSYIADDKMSIVAASRKINMSRQAARRHYRQYLIDNNLEIPAYGNTRPYSQDKKDEVVGYIVDDKMSIAAASKKANICAYSGQKYYRQYLKDHSDIPTPKRVRQDRINQLIGYIVDDKMSIKEASKKANMTYTNSHRLYSQYRKDHHLDYPILKRYTQEQKNDVIGYVENDKMSIRAASIKANVSPAIGLIHYHRYLNDQKRDTPTRCPRVVSARKNK
jgi:hypothetical protein